MHQNNPYSPCIRHGVLKIDISDSGMILAPFESVSKNLERLDRKLQLNYTIEKETHWDKTKINKIV